MREIIAEITKGYSNRQEKNYLRYEADFIYHSLKNTDKSPKSIHNNYVENSMFINHCFQFTNHKSPPAFDLITPSY